MGYKYTKLTLEEQLTLEEGACNHSKSYFRKRCACVLLSARGYEIKSLASIYKTRVHTIGTWLDNWNKKGIVGLKVVSGQGRKSLLSSASPELVQQIKDAVAAHPQDLTGVCQQINITTSLNVSKSQLKDFLKKS